MQPLSSITLILPVEAPFGTNKSIVVSVPPGRIVAETPFKVANVDAPKLVPPVIVTVVPIGPDDGEIDMLEAAQAPFPCTSKI